MLKYFTMTVDALVIAAVLTGLLRGYTKLSCGRLGRVIASVGIGLGVVSAGIMAYMKNATSKVDTSMWNYRIFIVTLSALGVLLVMCVLKLAVPVFKKGKGQLVGNAVAAAAAAVLLWMILLYALPDVLAYPYTLLLTEKTAFSTDYLFKMIGMALGIILVLLFEMAAFRGIQRLSPVQSLIVLYAALAVNGLRVAGSLLKVMFNKRMILPSNPKYNDYFDIVKFVSNNDIYFTYGILAVLIVIPVLIWIMSFRQKEPYSNPAEKRKIRKKWKVNRHWANLAVCVTAMMLVSIFVIEPYVNKPVELSPVEETTVIDGNINVPFEAVDDGHLHRFGYTTPNGKHVRFIVIKKPNSTSYGVGLDACEICHETGYFERDGQVVCKLCDVVMNINTIGFKGGCNPIVFEYTVKDGKIIVPVTELIAHENEFKS